MSSSRSAHHPTSMTLAGIPVFALGGLQFVRVPAGTFFMGSVDDSPLAHDNEKTRHVVDVAYGFWLPRFLVTNEQYPAYVGQGRHPVTGWETKRNHPVVNVSWKAAMACCRRLNDSSTMSCRREPSYAC